MTTMSNRPHLEQTRLEKATSWVMIAAMLVVTAAGALLCITGEPTGSVW